MILIIIHPRLNPQTYFFNLHNGYTTDPKISIGPDFQVVIGIITELVDFHNSLLDVAPQVPPAVQVDDIGISDT
jgi:hypothetical protein